MVIGDWGFQLNLETLTFGGQHEGIYPLSAVIRGSIFDIYLSVKEEGEMRVGIKLQRFHLAVRHSVILTAMPHPGCFWPWSHPRA